jgi:type I restriction-modification system DNA methylase subunit
MKNEIINSIAKEIYRESCSFRDQVVMKELGVAPPSYYSADTKTNPNPILNLYHSYKEKNLPVTGKTEFAAIYSHTVIFILLSANLFNKTRRSGVNAINNRLTKKISRLAGTDSIIHDIFESITMIDIPESLISFIKTSKDKLAEYECKELEEDVLAMLYERFLRKYEPVLHKKIMYYYTPGPVVSFMVHWVNQLLKDKLQIAEGLSDLDIRILDPAFGTANFLEAALKLAIYEKTSKYGEFTGKHLWF